MIRAAVLLLLAAIAINGCVADAEPEIKRDDAILDYYMPRNTENRYLYNYSGRSSGKRDSLFNVDYLGKPNAPVLTIDGYASIHQYTVSSTDGLRSVDIDLYVSDSVVVEYGTDCTSAAERFIPLKGRLKKGNTWQAAHAYQANDYQISFRALVIDHFEEITVADSVTYNDVWQVNYEVSAQANAVNPSKEYLPKARRVIYFARGIGKVYEIAFSPQNEMQWENELLRVERR